MANGRWPPNASRGRICVVRRSLDVRASEGGETLCALLTGVSSRAAPFLAELLAYAVHGILRDVTSGGSESEGWGLTIASPSLPCRYRERIPAYRATVLVQGKGVLK